MPLPPILTILLDISTSQPGPYTGAHPASCLTRRNENKPEDLVVSYYHCQWHWQWQITYRGRLVHMLLNLPRWNSPTPQRSLRLTVTVTHWQLEAKISGSTSSCDHSGLSVACRCPRSCQLADYICILFSRLDCKPGEDSESPAGELPQNSR